MEDMGVVEPPWLGKKFVWYQPNGRAASRIDRFLLSQVLIEEWCIKAQWIGTRDVSDHYPVWLVSSNMNWAPKPFRFINGWLEKDEGKQFIEEKWRECKVEGWMAHVVKEKLKYVKERLKVWNKEVYGVIDLNIENIVKEMNMVEEEVDGDGEKWKNLNTEFWREIQRKDSLLAQKARVNWIKQGDGNTKFCHKVVKFRQRQNQIEMLKVEERWLNGVDEIKEEVRRHFSNQFKEESFIRPKLEDINFKSIYVDESEFLVSPLDGGG